MQPDNTDLHDLVNKYRKAWSQQDTPSLMKLHSEDTEWINAFARMFQNRTMLADFMAERMFPAFKPETSIAEMDGLKLISLRRIGDNAAIIHMYTDSDRGVSRVQGQSKRRVHIHLVLSKTDQSWKIVHTAIMDARS